VVRNPIYSTGVGLLTYGLQKQSEDLSLTGISNSSNNSYGDEPKAPVLERSSAGSRATSKFQSSSGRRNN
jgi:cell division protein FtsA